MTGRDPSAPLPGNYWECLNCGAMNDEGEDYCENCGADTDGVEPEEEDDEEQTEREYADDE